MATSRRYRTLLSGPGRRRRGRRDRGARRSRWRHRRPLAPRRHERQRQRCSSLRLRRSGARARWRHGRRARRRRWRGHGRACRRAHDLARADGRGGQRSRPPTTNPRSTSRRKRTSTRPSGSGASFARTASSCSSASASSCSTRSSRSRARCSCNRGLQNGVLEGSEKVLFVSSAFFFLTVTADWLLTWTYTRYTGRTAERLLYALRIRIFAHLQRLALDYYDREMAGRIMTRMTTDVDAFSNLLQTGIIQALVSLMSFVGVLVVLAVLSWQLTLAVMAILPPLIIATVWFRRVSSRAYTRARDAISTVNAEFQENISGVRVAQAYVREETNIDSFRNTTDVYKNARVTTQQIQSFYFPLIMFLSTCADAIVFGYGGTPRATGRHHQRHRAHVRPVPRPVLRADPAALAGVRPVAVGARVDDEDQRAHAHRGVHARRGAPGRAGSRHGRDPPRRRALRLPEHRRRDHARGQPHDHARRDGRAWWARPGPGSPPSSSSSHGSTTSPGGRS